MRIIILNMYQNISRIVEFGGIQGSCKYYGLRALAISQVLGIFGYSQYTPNGRPSLLVTISKQSRSIMSSADKKEMDFFPFITNP